MIRPDDQTVSTSEMAAIRKEADRLLRAASAYGRFPTPVEDIIAAAKLKVEKEASLDVG